MEWKLIDSAPRGEFAYSIGAMLVDGKPVRACMIYWGDIGWYEPYSGKSAHYVTHWIPLPEPPQRKLKINLDRSYRQDYIEFMKTFKHARFDGKRDYECTQICFCIAASAPTEFWAETSEEIPASMIQIERCGDVRFFGWL